MVMYDNEFKTNENKIQTKEKIEPQHIFPLVMLKLTAYHDVRVI